MPARKKTTAKKKSTAKKSTAKRSPAKRTTRKKERQFGPEVDDAVAAQTIARESERKE